MCVQKCLSHWKTIPVIRIAVRETIASLGIMVTHRGQPLKPLEPSHHYGIEGFMGKGGGPNDAILSDSECNFFPVCEATTPDMNFFSRGKIRVLIKKNPKRSTAQMADRLFSSRRNFGISFFWIEFFWNRNSPF